MHISCRRGKNVYYNDHSPVFMAKLLGALREAWTPVSCKYTVEN